MSVCYHILKMGMLCTNLYLFELQIIRFHSRIHFFICGISIMHVGCIKFKALDLNSIQFSLFFCSFN